MNFELDTHQEELQRGAIEFARASLGGSRIHADRAEVFDRAGWQACASFGVLGMAIPPQYGGLGLGLSSLLAVMEGLGYGTRDQGLLFSMNAHLWTNSIPILHPRHRGPAPPVSARTVRRHTHRRQRRERAGCRLRHLLDAHARHTRRRVLRAQRDEDVRHERAGGRPCRRVRHGRSSAGRDRSDRVHHRARHSRHDDQSPARQDGPAHVADGGDRLRGLSRAGREPARTRRPGRAGLRELDGMGARLHPGNVPRGHAAAT